MTISKTAPFIFFLLIRTALSFTHLNPSTSRSSAAKRPFGTPRSPSHPSPSKTLIATRTSVPASGSELNLLSEAWDSYNVALNANPLLVKSLTAGVILGAADLTGQGVENFLNKKEGGDDKSGLEVDAGRAIRFAIFGLVLQAPWNHFYYLMLDGALPPTVDPFSATTGIKVVIDQFVQAPIFTVLIFLFLGVLEGKTLDMVKKQLDEDYVDTMQANWKLWVPATAVNIAFCPPVLRVLFLNVVFFFWSIFLSLKLNKSADSDASE